MTNAYLYVIVMLHTAFAAVFIFLNRERPSRFARLFATCWLIEGLRAAILLPQVHGTGPVAENWYALGDVLCLVANACLVAGAAALAEINLPRYLGPIYFGVSVPVLLFNRYVLPVLVAKFWGANDGHVLSNAILANLIFLFVPVAIARTVIVFWLFRLWRTTRMPAAFIAAVFAAPYAIVALAVPIQFIYSYAPDWISLMWTARVLGFSIGLVMLMLNFQQAAVARSEASLIAAQALARIGSWEHDVRAGVTVWSQELYRLYGRAPADGPMSYEEFLSAMHPDDRQRFRRDKAQAMAEHRCSDHEFRIAQADGSHRWIRGRTTPVFDDAGQLIRVAGVEQDVTEAKRAEMRAGLQHAVTRVLAEGQPLQPTLRRMLEIMAHALDADYVGFWTTEREGRALRRLETWSTDAFKLGEFITGAKSDTWPIGVGVPGRVLAARQPLFVSGHSRALVEEDPRIGVAHRAGLHSASGFPVLFRTEIFGVVEFFTTEHRIYDVETVALYMALGAQIGQYLERQRLEERYRQSQKMEAVGTLAGGIAHDFNNILTAINGYSELALLEAEPNPSLQSHLKAVQSGAHRAIDLVKQIMSFSRQRERQRSPVVVADVVNEAIKLLRATIPSTIEIVTSFEKSLPLVLADATSLHQVIVNLGTNASHAMKDRVGRLSISLASEEVDAAFAAARHDLRIGQYVKLTVSDTGVGMSAGTLSRIFEPFFTTKAPGEGTGLGLAVVHGIMQSHGGAIYVSSEVGVGTRFELYFPGHQGPIAATAKDAAPSTPRGHGERVFFLDDEKELAAMGKKILEKLGYAVTSFDDAKIALEAFRERARDFDVVVTDLTMPGLTGLEFTNQIRTVRPEIPVVLTSGYTASLTADGLQAQGVTESLLKPHTLDTLGQAVHRALLKRAFVPPSVAPA
jgi:PAS domain S-box-containing protein